eukprot:CAMPEP_0183740006 /NCGR_PEP_ID=MMETSP0737-20130205/58643_1 /TAXON_ID=385413 /ORGANISM="Thalassiosira miniscula, Strain CCMP1093" /LENGTH=481 /DNA_ID=CAMNT_0025974973 /DNA_START=49 /DNA_END=1494 /DNA_ORIENTATION=-
MSSSSTDPNPPPPPPPISLGKPSLRHRLESYYTLIAPDAISDVETWKTNFELIYEKYGGSVEGERKLRKKLAKKYGERVLLLVAPERRGRSGGVRRGGGGGNANDSSSSSLRGGKHDESHYEIDQDRKNSRILDFTSLQFDAVTALLAPLSIVTEANPSIFDRAMNANNMNSANGGGAKLDNISKFRSYLPECDPQRLEPPNNSAILSSLAASSTAAAVQKKAATNKTLQSSSSSSPTQTPKKPSLFLAMNSKYATPQTGGPLSLLYSILAHRQRVRIMVRYVDCVRGTLTGFLVAFDKHWNMILRDVEEVYGGRVTRCDAAVEVASEAVAAPAPGETTAGKSGAANASSANAENDRRSIFHERAPSKSKLEAQRRTVPTHNNNANNRRSAPPIKQRYFHQLLVRGDNVVMVWRAEEERSVFPKSDKSPTRSMYPTKDDDNSTGKPPAMTGREDATTTINSGNIGTPGSLYYALRRWEKNR